MRPNTISSHEAEVYRMALESRPPKQWWGRLWKFIVRPGGLLFPPELTREQVEREWQHVMWLRGYISNDEFREYLRTHDRPQS